jgi:exodeoxyribonuclease-5
MQFGAQQSSALDAVAHWYHNESKFKQVFYLGGYAGTGKTTLAKHFANLINGITVYGAYTGKAALVMRKNGCVGASTLHSLIYIPQVQKDGSVKFIFNRESPLQVASLIIIDECSMVNEELARDLLRFGKPVLVLGDPAQLPPVSGEGFFTRNMPDAMLTEIHRQAADNPVIWLASRVRKGHELQLGTYDNCTITNKLNLDDMRSADQIIAGRHVTRELVNNKMRAILGFEGDYPSISERVLCMKNDRDAGVFNGGTYEVTHVADMLSSPGFFKMSLDSMDEDLKTNVKVHRYLFDAQYSKPKNWKVLKGSQEFDFAYAMTCHKAQGSQWGVPFIWDESWCFREHSANWLYTAITRTVDYFTIYRK